MGSAKQAFSLRRRCSSAHTGADEVSSRFRSFLSRLRLAWLVLIGKALPSHNFRVFYPSSGFSVSTLHSSCWVSAGKRDFAEDMIRRELLDLVSPYILFTEDPWSEGGSTITGNLYIYVPEQEAHP